MIFSAIRLFLCSKFEILLYLPNPLLWIQEWSNFVETIQTQYVWTYIVAVIFVYFQLKWKTTKFDQKVYQTHMYHFIAIFEHLKETF